jgi:hypothetical protein
MKLREKGFAGLLLNLDDNLIKTMEEEYIDNAGEVFDDIKSRCRDFY